jgi:predicted pyridoxine 5'-phosphate oxidase superfamily flavin-nucleotide-binding protein
MAFYTEAQRAMQAQFETQTLAATMEATIIEDSLNERNQAFISSRDFFFLSTVNANGEPTVSHKGGGIGTVKVIDAKTLAFPAYDGNGMFLSLGNIADTAKIGMLFMDFETPNRVRVQATAHLQENDPLLAEYPGAIAVVRAHVDQAFINCARYIHKHKRMETSRYVPDSNGDAPLATWKRIDGLQGRLHPNDEGRAEQEGGLITEQQYGEALAKGES